MTAVSAESKAIYERIGGMIPKGAEPTAIEACVAARRLWRKFMGETFKGEIRIRSGRIKTWVYGPSYRREIRLNPGRGWEDMIHSLSHYIHGATSKKRPHGAEHANLELRMVRFALEGGWFEGALRPKPRAQKPAATKPDPKVAKLAKVKASIKRWTTKQRRAETALGKLARQERTLERAIAKAAGIAG